MEYTFKRNGFEMLMNIEASSLEEAFDMLVMVTKHPTDWVLQVPTVDLYKEMLGEPLADDGPNDKDQDDLIAGDYEQFPPEKGYTFDDLDKNFSRL